MCQTCFTGFYSFSEGTVRKMVIRVLRVIRVLQLLSSLEAAKFIFSLSKEHDIAIDMEWIPRSDNEVADYLSKIVDFDDWGVKDSSCSGLIV